MLLLEAGLFACTDASHSRHVHLVDGVDVRADGHALHHSLGDDGAHLGERNLLTAQFRKCLRRSGQRWSGRACRCCDFGRRAAWPVQAQMAQDILFGDARARASARDLREVEVVVFGNPPHQRRGANVLASDRRIGGGHLRHLLFRRGSRGYIDACRCAANDRNHGVDLDGCAFLNLDLTQHARHRRRNLGIHLVGRNFK